MTSLLLATFLALTTVGDLPETIIFLEGFEDAFPPEGWQVVQTNPGHFWTQVDSAPGGIGPYKDNLFLWIEADAAPSDEWLITPSIDLGPYEVVDFNAALIGSDDEAPPATTSFLISNDDGNSWEEIFAWPGGVYDYDPYLEPFEWFGLAVDVSEHVGEVVRFAMRYAGQNGEPMGLDQVWVWAGPVPDDDNPSDDDASDDDASDDDYVSDDDSVDDDDDSDGCGC